MTAAERKQRARKLAVYCSLLTVGLIAAFLVLDMSSFWSVVIKFFTAVAGFTSGLFALLCFGASLLIRPD